MYASLHFLSSSLVYRLRQKSSEAEEDVVDAGDKQDPFVYLQPKLIATKD